MNNISYGTTEKRVYIVYLMVSVEQPDDGPIAGPKHVVVIYYIVLSII